VVGTEGSLPNLVQAGIGSQLQMRPRNLVRDCGPACRYPAPTSTVTTTTSAPCYQFLTSNAGGGALYFHKRLSPTKHLVRIGHCRACGYSDVCRAATAMAEEAFLQALQTGTDFTCDMLKNKTCGNLTEALPKHPSILASSPPASATWLLLALAILCWISCAGALAWLLFTYGAAHFSGHKEDRNLVMMPEEKSRHGMKLKLEDSEEDDTGTEEDSQPLLPAWSTCGLPCPCASVRSIPEHGGVQDFDVVTVGPDGFEVRPASDEEFDVVTVSPEGFEVRPASPKYALRGAFGDQAMHTTILEPPVGTVQHGMHTTILEPPPGMLQQGMQTTVLEQPPFRMTPTMQTTILEQPPS